MTGDVKRVGVVGAGLVGSSWTIVFARAGLPVRVFDGDAAGRARCLPWVEATLKQLQSAGLLVDAAAALAKVEVVDTLGAAVAGADYVQESVFEKADVKNAVCRQIGPLLKEGAICGSSSSGIPASAFTADVGRRERFLIVHPVNPPHLVPVVEIVPAPWTDAAVVPAVRGFIERLGQVPVVATREIEGFLLNRLQGVLLMEAWKLYEEGYASLEDLDRTVRDGLGLRWSFMGPFETIDLNAPGGIADYARRLGPLYHSIASKRSHPHPWDEPLIQRAEAERRAALPLEQLGERSRWRDRRLMALVAHKTKQKEEEGA